MRNLGCLAALAAYVMWGLLPIYWKQIDSVDSQDILAWRMVFCCIWLLPLALRCSDEIRAAMTKRSVLIRLVASTSIIALNWGTYIWSVNHGYILESSLGYYINPLMTMACGFLLFSEPMDSLQKCACGLALTGVVLAVIGYGTFPFIALLLAISFTIYGVIRKTVAVDAVPGLFIETLIMLPLASVWLLFHASPHSYDTASWLYLIGTGIITTLPLGLFAYAARHIDLVMLGFIQFISPTLSFLVGVTIYGETVGLERAIMFGFVWLGLLVYCLDMFRKSRQRVTGRP